LFGTEGGRPRDTTVVSRDELVRSLNAAVAYSAEHGGKLVDKAGLRSSRLIVIEMWLSMLGYKVKKHRIACNMILRAMPSHRI